MTTIASIALPVADSWQISVGGGWIALMLIGMGLCFVFMIGSMWLMRDARVWPLCGLRWPQQTTHPESWTGTPVRSSDAGVRPESEA